MNVSEIKQRYFKKVVVLAMDACLVILSLPAALFIRLDPVDAKPLIQNLDLKYHVLSLFLFLVGAYVTKSYRVILRLANLFTALRVVGALVITFSLFYLFSAQIFTFQPVLPRSTFLIQILVCSPLAVGFRFSFRILERLRVRRTNEGKRTVVFGAGLTTDRILPMLLRSADKHKIVGLLDDDTGKRGCEVQGVRVLGGRKDLAEIVEKYNVEQVIISMPSVPGTELRQLVHTLARFDVLVKTLPDPDAFFSGRQTNHIDVRDINIEDLLRRPPRNLDREAIRATIEDKVVLVTGGGGSIGAELCRQVARAKPSVLLVNDASEFALYSIHQELTAKFPDLKITPCLGDVSDERLARSIFGRSRPQVVFHACAYKHVPLCEENVSVAFRNNVGTALTVFEMSELFEAERVVLVSSDKAVRPTNVMGTTKRICELLALWFAQHGTNARTKFCSVRFGNVLGSSGSVIPLFMDQITKGGPVTVTHPDITRYFMLIPEAASLVLQACAKMEGTGEIFVLNMGEPVRIVDLARDLISTMGYEPDKDIKITYSGLRPGEKMYEELSLEHEFVEKVNEDYSQVANIIPTPKSLSETLKRKLISDEVHDADHLKLFLRELLQFDSPTQKILGNPQGTEDNKTIVAMSNLTAKIEPWLA